MSCKYNHLDLPAPKSVEASAISKQAFHDKIVIDHKPLVIRGLANHWDIVERQNHSDFSAIEYLKESVSDTKLSLTKIDSSERSRMFYNNNMSAMNFGVAKVNALACFDYIAEQKDGADYAVQCVPIEKNFPALEAKLKIPLLDYSVSPFAWFGNRVIVAPHFDEAHNIAVVAAGKRRFTLFPPDQTKNLYIGPLDNTPAGQPISLVNILDPDIAAHPNYAEAFKQGLSVELEPGDAIFIPSPWWHHVESLSDFNVLINYWWTECETATPMPFPMLMHAIQSIKPMQKEQKAAWKAILMHYVFEEGDPSEHLPEHAKGVLGKLTPIQLQEINRWIKEQLS